MSDAEANESDQWVDAKVLAARWQCSVRAIRRFEADGRIPRGRRLGRRLVRWPNSTQPPTSRMPVKT